MTTEPPPPAPPTTARFRCLGWEFSHVTINGVEHALYRDAQLDLDPNHPQVVTMVDRGILQYVEGDPKALMEDARRLRSQAASSSSPDAPKSRREPAPDEAPKSRRDGRKNGKGS